MFYPGTGLIPGSAAGYRVKSGEGDAQCRTLTFVDTSLSFQLSNKHFPVLLQMLHAVTQDPHDPFKRKGLEAETTLSSYTSRVKVMCSSRAWMGVSPATCCTTSQTQIFPGSI